MGKREKEGNSMKHVDNQHKKSKGKDKEMMDIAWDRKGKNNRIVVTMLYGIYI